MSIQSTLKTISMADKMSVSQLQQAVKAGTIPAYIAVPLIQERMKDKQQAQVASAAGQPQQPPVAQQVMAQADQDAIASLPAGMPAEYAHGGIVAFAEGGDTEDLEDYNEAIEEDEFKNYAQAMINRTPATGMGYGQVQGAALRAARQPAKGGEFDASGHKYDDLATTYAEQIGLNPALARYALKKETGGLKDPEKAVSRAGAIGPMQLMPATAKGLGVDPRDPAQNVMGGVKYLKQMMDRYGDERLALAAYNAGPGRVDAALRSERGIAGLPAETMRYIGMADGGIVNFAAGDLVDIGGNEYTETEDPEYVMADGVRTSRKFVEQSAQSPWNTRPKGEPIQVMPEGLGENLKMGLIKPAAAAADVISYPMNKLFKGVNALTGTSIPVSESDTPFYDKYVRGAQPVSAPAAAAAAPAPKAEEKPKAEAPAPVDEKAKADEGKKDAGTQEAAKVESPYEKLIRRIEEGDVRRAKQAEQDKYMGLLGAGLGMMAGKSQNPWENIGQGAMYGLGQYGQARKQTAAEEAAADKAMATALRYKSLDEYYKEQGQATRESKADALAQRTRSDAAEDRERFFNRQLEVIKGSFPKDPTLWTPEQKAQYEAAVQKIYTMPGYIALDRVANPSSYAGFRIVKPATQ